MIIENPELKGIFRIQTANGWTTEGGKQPAPAQLFGDLWRENELAILFADTAKGKSLLAVQIAESIARGRPIEPFQMTASPQKVLYLDFELSAKQFEIRYASEAKPGRPVKHYRFSDRFIRAQLRPEANRADESEKLEVRIRKMIAPLIEATGAKVLIIDNITYLKRTADGTRETMPLMKELKSLKDSLGLSVLVIAHTPKRDSRRPLDVNDLAGSKILSNFVDNIFAIGQSGAGADLRYIKHIKGRSTEQTFGSAHVPVYRLSRIKGKFLGFEFLHCAPEKEQIRDIRDGIEREFVERIRMMSAQGKSVRTIATELEMSKSKVHRLLKIAETMRPEPAHECDHRCSGDHLPGWLPAEDFDSDEPDEFDGIFDNDDPESMAKRRELYLRDARRSPEWVEPASEDESSAVEEPLTRSPASVHPLMPPGVTMQLNAYGKEIYVESEESGRPKVWYSVNASGDLKRWERKVTGIFGSTVVAPEVSTA